MKTKLDSKKPAASSSSSSSSDSDSDDAASKVSKAKGIGTAKIAPKTTPKPVAKATPVKEAIPPKKVPASKFPKAAASSSSDSDSDSDSDSSPPPTKKANMASTTPKSAANNLKPVANNTAAKATPAANNVKSPVKTTAPPSPMSSQQSQGKTGPSPKHVATPVRNPPAAQVAVPAPTPVKRAFNQAATVTVAGDEPYQRVEPKKLVTSVFGSNCPHCGHDIEVKVKFS